MTRNKPQSTGPPVPNAGDQSASAPHMGSSGEHVETDQILIAALGASAGGLEAFEKFFTHVPERTGIAFVIVQHLAPDHSSALAEILARHTRMVVEQAHDNTQVAPNRVYIIPPNATLTINKSTLRVATPTAPRGRSRTARSGSGPTALTK